MQDFATPEQQLSRRSFRPKCAATRAVPCGTYCFLPPSSRHCRAGLSRAAASPLEFCGIVGALLSPKSLDLRPAVKAHRWRSGGTEGGMPSGNRRNAGATVGKRLPRVVCGFGRRISGRPLRPESLASRCAKTVHSGSRSQRLPARPTPPHPDFHLRAAGRRRLAPTAMPKTQ
jgi:hypothetical protein